MPLPLMDTILIHCAIVENEIIRCWQMQVLNQVILLLLGMKWLLLNLHLHKILMIRLKMSEQDKYIKELKLKNGDIKYIEIFCDPSSTKSKELKSIIIVAGEGNPNHDEKGQFSSGDGGEKTVQLEPKETDTP